MRGAIRLTNPRLPIGIAWWFRAPMPPRLSVPQQKHQLPASNPSRGTESASLILHRPQHQRTPRRQIDLHRLLPPVHFLVLPDVFRIRVDARMTGKDFGVGVENEPVVR